MKGEKKFITFNGKTMHVAAWAKTLNVAPCSISSRLNRGWAVEDALSRKPQRRSYHGASKSKLWNTWAGMRSRCTNPKAPHYEYYGGRGIKVCDRWQDFNNFRADMGEPPFAEAQIDRINNDGNYEPNNCRWVNRTEQSRNKRSNILITISNRTQCLTAWAHECQMSLGTVYCRITRLGWEPLRAITQPVRRKRNG